MISVAYCSRIWRPRTSILALGLAWLVASCAHAVAQDAQSVKKNKAAPKPADRVRILKSGESPKATQPLINRRKRGRTQAQIKPDPNSKWACDKTEVVLPPVWRGKKELTFAFDIRNEGTADLHIRAKGG